MGTITLDRIVELWPSLSAEARQQIAGIVESDAGKDMPLDLSDEEERLLAARNDFKHGHDRAAAISLLSLAPVPVTLVRA